MEAPPRLAPPELRPSLAGAPGPEHEVGSHEPPTRAPVDTRPHDADDRQPPSQSRRGRPRKGTLVLIALVLVVATGVMAVTVLIARSRASDAARGGFRQAYLQVAAQVRADTTKAESDSAAGNSAAERADLLAISSAMSDFEASLRPLDFGSHQGDADNLAADSSSLGADWRAAADNPGLAALPPLSSDAARWDADSRRLAADLSLAIDSKGNLSTP